VSYGSLNARLLYPNLRQGRPNRLPGAPIVGTNSPVQYEPTDTPGVRKQMPWGATDQRGELDADTCAV
jgi:hypothetical protein